MHNILALEEAVEKNKKNKSFGSQMLDRLKSNMLKNYLYNLWIGEIKDEEIKVTKLIGIPSFESPIVNAPNFNLNDLTKNLIFNDNIFIASIVYKSETYEIIIRTFFENTYHMSQKILMYNISANGISSSANSAEMLITNMLNKCIINSSFNNSLILLDNGEGKTVFFDRLKIISPKPANINEIFLPEIKKEQIKRFIESIKNFETNNISLRYLLSGLPGTGKTKIINSIINAVYEDVTILITNGGNIPLDDIFKFCSIFDKILLVIDDVDFIIGERTQNNEKDKLGNFLQYLDGFIPNQIFLLASTNDKTLVDNAASRPGRFDMILDIGEINPSSYLHLVKRETNDEEVLKYFTKPVIEKMKMRKVTGAYIVSFVKQLKSVKTMKGNLTQKDFDQYFDLTYKGFYSSNENKSNCTLGFGVG